MTLKLRNLTLVLFVAALAISCDNSKETQRDWAKSDYHYKLARGNLKDRKIAAAMRECFESLKYNPKNVMTHYLLGFISMGRQDFTRAERHLKLAVQYKPDFHHASNSLGVVYLHLKRWDDAIRIFKKLVDEPLYDSPWLAHNNLGWALYQKGLLSKQRVLLLRARQHFDKALLTNPKFCVGYNNKGIVLEAMQNWDQAALSYRRSIDICKAYIEPMFRLGFLYERAHKPQLAAEMFSRCYKLAPNTPFGQRCLMRKRRLQP